MVVVAVAEGLVVAEEVLGEVVMIEEGMIGVDILLEVDIVEDTGAGPGVMHHIKGRSGVVWPCIGTTTSKEPSKGRYRVWSSARISVYWALCTLIEGCLRLKSIEGNGRLSCK